MQRFPVVVDQHTSLFAAWGKLRRTGAQHLVVIDEGLRPTGVLDERDIALEWPPGPLAAQHLPVHQLLGGRTRPRVRGGEDIATVAATMRSAHVDAVPVVDREGRLLGLVTAQHCVELIAGAPTVGGWPA
jgi:CBS domain-containing protein